MIKTCKPRDDAQVEAMLFDSSTAMDALKWAGDSLRGRTSRTWLVDTLEGWVDIPFGHYLIKGTHGEFYPCDPDVFEKRWQEAAE